MVKVTIVVAIYKVADYLEKGGFNSTKQRNRRFVRRLYNVR